MQNVVEAIGMRIVAVQWHAVASRCTVPLQTSLVPIHRLRKDKRLGWFGRQIQTKNIELECMREPVPPTALSHAYYSM